MNVQTCHPHPATAYPLTDESTLLARIRGEFLEMPGLRVSFEQAMRLWAIDAEVCRCALDRLLAGGFLMRDINGRYKKADGGY